MKYRSGILLAVLMTAKGIWAQTPESTFDRRNSFTVLAEYADDSSHIVAGSARQRKLVTLGGAYTRRVVRFWGSEIGYRIELRPLVFVSDPVDVIQQSFTTTTYGTQNTTSIQAIPQVCQPSQSTQVEPTPPPIGNVTITTQVRCGRQWTFGQSFTPFGFLYTTRIRHAVQPYIVGTLGYMYTSRPIPVAQAEAFNFVVDLGAGVQLYRSGKRSISLESRLRHISNRNTAAQNPGVDTVTYSVAYTFGH